MDIPADVRGLIAELAAFLYDASTGGSAWDLESSVGMFPEAERKDVLRRDMEHIKSLV